MLISFFYEVLLILAALPMLLKLAYGYCFKGKYRRSFPQRWGFGFPKIEKDGRKLIWIHAVSLGETLAVAALAKKLKERADHPIIVLSTCTETGHMEGIKSIPEADFHVYLPFDFKWIIKPIVQMVKPDLCIFCETDFWYNFMTCCKKNGAHLVLVNGKLSEKSLRRYRLFPFFTRPLFDMIDKFCVQNNLYQERFLQIGVPQHKIAITGNMKFDTRQPELSAKEKQEWREKLGIGEKDLALVIGSTHDPEERLLMEKVKNVRIKVPNLFVIIAPRHPERFDAVAGILKEIGEKYSRYSQLNDKGEGAKTLLLDAMGVLRSCYQLADAAIVAGSFTSKLGGHNIMEPAFFGVPVLFGPFMSTQGELVDIMQQYKAGLQLSVDCLEDALIDLLVSSEKRGSMGKSASCMSESILGAVDRTYHSIFSFLSL